MIKSRIVTLPLINYSALSFQSKYYFTEKGLPDVEQASFDDDSCYPLNEFSCWNRWLLSHHCSFLIWSLVIHGLNESHVSLSENSLNIYNEILTYTRVIQPADYDRDVRPIMATFWPGFSAVWSYEFQHLKAQLKSVSDQEMYLPVKTAYKKAHFNHLETAKSLVPQGKSLLQEIKKAGKLTPTSDELLHFAYDSLFLIRRAPVSRAEVELQIVDKFRSLIEDAKHLSCLHELPHTQALYDSLYHKWYR